jgi:hypothetical protein
MYQLLEYYGRWQGFKERLARLPAFARLLVGLAAIPGIILVGLSIVAILVSLLALFLLTVPLYRALCWVCGVSDQEAQVRESNGFGPVPEGMDVVVEQAGEPEPSVEVSEPPRTRRQIEVKIIDSDESPQQ